MNIDRISYKYIPNILSLMRGLLVLPFVYGIYRIYVLGYGKNSVLIVLFSIIIISDLLDGFFARKFDSASTFGAKLDIFSDAFYTLSSLIILAYINITPVWFIYIMTIKLLEFIVTSKIIHRKQKTNDVAIFDKIGEISVLIIMLLPGIFVFRCVILDYKIVMNSIIYLVTIMFIVSFIYRITKTIKIFRI